jgi:hypothetical protein
LHEPGVRGKGKGEGEGGGRGSINLSGDPHRVVGRLSGIVFETAAVHDPARGEDRLSDGLQAFGGPRYVPAETSTYKPGLGYPTHICTKLTRDEKKKKTNKNAVRREWVGRLTGQLLWTGWGGKGGFLPLILPIASAVGFCLSRYCRWDTRFLPTLRTVKLAVQFLFSSIDYVLERINCSGPTYSRRITK